MLSCDFYKISKNTFFYRTPPVTAFVEQITSFKFSKFQTIVVFRGSSLRIFYLTTVYHGLWSAPYFIVEIKKCSHCSTATFWRLGSNAFRLFIWICLIFGTIHSLIKKSSEFVPSRKLRVKSQQWEYYTRSTLTSFWCIYCQLWTNSVHCSVFFIVDFQQVSTLIKAEYIIFCFFCCADLRQKF